MTSARLVSNITVKSVEGVTHLPHVEKMASVSVNSLAGLTPRDRGLSRAGLLPALSDTGELRDLLGSLAVCTG